MKKPDDFKGGAQEPSPDDLLTTGQIARMYGITYAAVRQWRLEPFDVVIIGENRTVRRYRRTDVEAYASSARRQNRLPKPTKSRD